MSVVAALLSGLLGVGCLLPPVEGPVVRGFEAPPCEWCAGHRGVRFDTAVGGPVRAPVAGVVGFAGAVAGSRWLTIEAAGTGALGGGRRVTVGPLQRIGVGVGARVVAGEVIGFSGRSLLLTLRAPIAGTDRYVDPAPWLAGPVLRPRLVPLDGRTPPRRRGAPRLVCPIAG